MLENGEKKGLTNIHERILGFVTAKTIIRDHTKDNRPRIIFDTMSGIEKNGNFPIVRHIICYGDAAKNLCNIHKGSYVKVNGFVVKTAMKDSAGFLIDSSRQMIFEEHVISEDAVEIPKEVYKQDRQLSFEGDTPAPVGRTS